MKYVSRIHSNELHFYAAKSSGPGGQNVNKRNTAVTLKWNLFLTNSFSQTEKDILLQRLQKRATEDGFLQVQSQESRSQERNWNLCLQKLDNLLEKAFYQPKKRKKTKPSKAAKIKRLERKSQRSKIKKNRAKPSFDD